MMREKNGSAPIAKKCKNNVAKKKSLFKWAL